MIGGLLMKPTNEGRKAFRKGDLANPYPVNTDNHRDWQFGFDRAYFTNLEKRVKIEQKSGKGSNGIRRSKKKTPQAVPT